jgi:hypothetical protein
MGTKRSKKFSGAVCTCAHTVSFEYWGFSSKLDETLEELLQDEASNRAHDMIADSGCVEGELNYYNSDTEEKIRGWWKIEPNR